MKVICIKNTDSWWGNWDNPYAKTISLTIGKTYLASNTSKHQTDDFYLIKNDTGEYWWYTKYLFKLVEEVRQEKLNDLGI